MGNTLRRRQEKKTPYEKAVLAARRIQKRKNEKKSLLMKHAFRDDSGKIVRGVPIGVSDSAKLAHTKRIVDNHLRKRPNAGEQTFTNNAEQPDMEDTAMMDGFDADNNSDHVPGSSDEDKIKKEETKPGMFGNVKKVVNRIIAKNEKRRFTKQYTREAQRNADLIRLITPELGIAFAEGVMTLCPCAPDQIRQMEVYCMDFTSCNPRSFDRCKCKAWTARLINAGYFPTKPNAVVAISLDILDLFTCISSNGSFSKMGFALGLREFHRRKFRFEPFRRYDEIFRACIPFYLRVRRVRDETMNEILNGFFKTKAAEKARQLEKEETLAKEKQQKEKKEEENRARAEQQRKDDNRQMELEQGMRDILRDGFNEEEGMAQGNTNLDEGMAAIMRDGLDEDEGMAQENPDLDEGMAGIMRDGLDEDEGMAQRNTDLEEGMAGITKDGLDEEAAMREAMDNGSELGDVLRRQMSEQAPVTQYPVVQIGGFVTLCPACFFRKPDDVLPVIIGIDGNVQHSRYAHVARGRVEQFPETLFAEVDYTERASIDASLASVQGTVCEHNFKAIKKPNSMTFKDETGLMMIVCRHDMPLRFLNMYAGERLGWVVYIIEDFIKLLEKFVGKLDVILLYDIACQLSPYIEKRHEDLHKRLVVAVNKFHGYAHEYRCQELFGQHQTKHIGQSDGEGTERVWALLRILVVSGRISTAANRVLFIETLAYAIMYRKRMQLGSAIWNRYRSQKSYLVHWEREFDKLQGIVVNDGNGNEAPIDEDLLRAEHNKQRAYFTTTAPLNSKPNVELFQKLLEERKLQNELDQLRLDFLEIDELDVLEQHDHQRIQGEVEERLHTATASIEQKLENLGQTREDWKDGGDRYMLAIRASRQEQTVFEALLAEEEAVKTLTEKEAVRPAYSEGTLNNYRAAVTHARLTTDAEMRLLGTNREDWAKGGLLWDREFKYKKLTELQVVYHRLLRAAACRTMLLRRAKAHTTGGKPAGKLIKGAQTNHAAMAKDIKVFNEICSTVPEYTKHKLSISAFNGIDDLSAVGTRAENARDALFHLHVLKSNLLGSLHGPKSFWTCSEEVRAGILFQLRRDRSREEMDLLHAEWRRNLAYTIAVLQGLLDYAMKPPTGAVSCIDNVHRMLWDELQAGENIVKAAEAARKKNNGNDVFPTDDLENLVQRIKAWIHMNYRFKPLNNRQPNQAPNQQPSVPQDSGQQPDSQQNSGTDLRQQQQAETPTLANTEPAVDLAATQSNNIELRRENGALSEVNGPEEERDAATTISEEEIGFGDGPKMEEDGLGGLKVQFFPEDENEGVPGDADWNLGNSSDEEDDDMAKFGMTSMVGALDEVAAFEGVKTEMSAVGIENKMNELEEED